ncbi:MAG TPA: hypothetical protein QF870_12295, partial [Nitrospinota bacterium]|nr:hypothetical protein [Nitrospinota bacterium]
MAHPLDTFVWSRRSTAFNPVTMAIRITPRAIPKPNSPLAVSRAMAVLRVRVYPRIYEVMPGWEQPTAGAERLSDLPTAARCYLERL